MILVDTSIWIDHLRSGDAAAARLLGDGLVVNHPWVTGELALGGFRRPCWPTTTRCWDSSRTKRCRARGSDTSMRSYSLRPGSLLMLCCGQGIGGWRQSRHVCGWRTLADLRPERRC